MRPSNALPRSAPHKPPGLEESNAAANVTMAGGRQRRFAPEQSDRLMDDLEGADRDRGQRAGWLFARCGGESACMQLTARPLAISITILHHGDSTLCAMNGLAIG